MSHPSDRAERIGAGPQMRPLAKLFERVPFFLQRVGFAVGHSHDGDFARVHFGRLTRRGRRFDLTLDDDAAADGQFLDFVGVIIQLVRSNDLQISQRRTVVQLDEAEPAFAVTAGAYPTADLDRFADGSVFAGGVGGR